MAESRASSPETHSPSFFQLLLSHSPEGNLLIIDLSVLLAIAFLTLRLVHGAIRRRVPAGGVATLAEFVHILTPLLIIYIIGLMHSASFRHELFPIWALVLVYAYGGVDTSTAHRFSDTNEIRDYFLHRIPLIFWCGWLIEPFLKDPKLTVGLVALLFMASFNGTETKEALVLASRSKGLPMAEHMRQGKQAVLQVDPDIDKTYFPLLFQDGGSITIEDVWGSPTSLLLHNSIVESDFVTYTRSEGLKDMALSCDWFWRLLRRFGALYDPGSQNTIDFGCTGLLSTDPARVDRLFRILEVELGLLYDFFYTKYFLLSIKRSRYKFHRLACVPFFLMFACVDNFGEGYLSYKYHGHSLEIGVTRVVMVVMALLEICQISMLFFSNWKIVILLCQYVENPNSSGCCIRLETLIICIWAIKDRLSRSKFLLFFLKPWQRKLGQYSFMKCYAKRPKLRKLTWLLKNVTNIPRVGQSGNFRVPLSIEVKCEIMSSLLMNSLTLSPGKATLERNELLSKLSYTWYSESNAELILIWHIATSACEFMSTPTARNKHFTVAKHISRYCAYLVTFSPELLPDHPRATELVFDKAVEEAHRFFNEVKLEKRYLKMMAITEAANDSMILAKGAVLGRQLIEHVLGDSSKGWRVLAEFWAELLLYMTPSSHEDAHGMHLAQGGEFITHLWALLTHAGIVTRDSFQTTVV